MEFFFKRNNKAPSKFGKQDLEIGYHPEGMEILELPAPEGWQANVVKVSEGYWFFWSWIKPEWRVEGKGIVGGADMPKEAKKKFEELTERYGTPPRDLIYRFEYKDKEFF